MCYQWKRIWKIDTEYNFFCKEQQKEQQKNMQEIEVSLLVQSTITIIDGMF